MEDQDKILVHTTNVTKAPTRASIRGYKELEVNVLANNVNIFLGQIDEIMASIPEDMGKYSLSKFIVSAEISATGQLVLLGTGVEAGVTGTLTFEFEK